MGPARSRFNSRDSIGRNAPRLSRERCADAMTARCAALGASAPNGAGEVSLAGVKRCLDVSCGAARCITELCRVGKGALAPCPHYFGDAGMVGTLPDASRLLCPPYDLTPP